LNILKILLEGLLGGVVAADTLEKIDKLRDE